MDIDIDNIRGRFALPSKNRSRELSILSSTSSKQYYERIEALNHLLSNND